MTISIHVEIEKTDLYEKETKCRIHAAKYILEAQVFE